MEKFKITEATKTTIKEFFSPFAEIYNLMGEDRDFTETEVNLLLTTVGKFPTYQGYDIIESLRNGVSTSENEQTNP